MINPPYRQKNAMVYMPMGLGYVGTVLKDIGHTVDVHDMNLLGTKPSYVVRLAKENAYEIICITGFITQAKHIKEISLMLHAENPEVKIIVGGSVSYGASQYLLQKGGVDAVVTGDGESVIPDIVEKLENNQIPDFKGVSYRWKNEFYEGQDNLVIKDLNKIPMLNHELFDVEKYIRSYHGNLTGKRRLEVTWSRSCPYSCVYCINSKRVGPYRIREVDSVVQELAYIRDRYKINDVAFASEVFTTNAKKVYNLCNKIKDFGMTWTIFARADMLDYEIVAVMKSAGLRQIMIGIESADNEVLKKMNKKITIEQVSDTINMVQSQGIEVHGGFISGLPWETEASVKKASSFCINHDQIYWPSYATAYPNTQLYDEIRHLIPDEFEYIEKMTDHQQFLSLLINMTSFSEEVLIKMHRCETEETLSCFIKKRYPYIPMSILKKMVKILLPIYQTDKILGMDIYSNAHKIFRKLYDFIFFNRDNSIKRS